MAQSRPNTKIKESLKLKTACNLNKDDSGCDTCPEESLTDTNLQDTDSESQSSEASKQKHPDKSCGSPSIKLRSTNRSKADSQLLPDVGRTGTSPTTHSNMKTKQAKEELDKSLDEDTVIEPKTRARKKASDINEDDKKTSPDEPKTSKETKKPIGKPKAVVKKRPLGIRKTLRSKKAIVIKEKVKNAIKQTAKRGRKPALKVNPEETQDKETVPLIPASEIKKEPGEDTTPNSRSSSPKTAGRRQRLSSDMAMMKTMLGDSPGSLVLGPRTSPYSMRSERSNSPSMFEGKNLRSGKPRKVKNLLSEVVIKEQKKRRRLHSDSKTSDTADTPEDCKKLKRGRSCSRDGSEISKCSDNTESDLSMSETLNDSDSKELNKKLDKSKTDLDIDIENNVQISTIEKVPSLVVDSKVAETKLDPPEPSNNANAKDKKLSLNRSTSLDSDNNNSNRINLDDLNSNEIEEKMIMKTDNTLFDARSSILTSMSKTFNSKEMSKNIRKARRGRKVMAASRPTPAQSAPAAAARTCGSSTVTADADDKVETIDTLTKEINDLINDLDQNIDGDMEMVSDTTRVTTDTNPDQMQTKTASKFYGLAKPINGDNIPAPETPVKDRDIISPFSNENTPSKNDDGENIRLRYEEDSAEKPTDGAKHEIPYKCSPVASIDKLMDRLKEFEEFDKRRQMESKASDSSSKPMMVTNDVVLIPKSGDIKPLKDIQSVRSPEKPFEKENVLSCFENNSAISIVKRDQVRKSTDIDMPNSVTLIKRNSFSSRKESTSSNHSKESSDAISIFEKSLGRDVTLTEIRKSVDKSAQSATQIDLHQFATLHPNTSGPNLGGVLLDSSQVSLTPRVIESKINNDKRRSRESMSRKSSESTLDTEDKMATIEKIKSPPHASVSHAVSITPAPVAMKSPEATPVETEALPPPIETIKSIEDIAASEVPKAEITKIVEAPKEEEAKTEPPVVEPETPVPTAPVVPTPAPAAPTPAPAPIVPVPAVTVPVPEPEKMEVEAVPEKKPEEAKEAPVVEEKEKTETVVEAKPVEPEVKEVKPAKSPKPKSARNSIESQAGPSNVLNETPESQKRKENVLRTLGLLTHKAAKEAKIEKLKEKERIYGSNYGGMMSTKNKSAKAQGDYTGTLKTVIKLNRGAGDKKKHRSSLKMTFQKSKYRTGKPTPEVGEAANEDDAYYTIERREGAPGAASDDPEAAPEPVEPKETLNLVIPEKASSFSIHPGRLCMDQCFYCGGKFGLFDTPCHIAQIKSSERQKKVLDNEEKLTIDSCLCDACYRHVDRRANCPSYRKRPLGKQPIDPPITSLHNTQTEKPVSPPLEEDSEEEAGTAGAAVNTGRVSLCHTEGCVTVADHSIRRKWLIKMRSSVNKLLKLKCDYPGLHTIPLCGEHHRALAPLMACVLCTRRITKHHNVHFIHHGYTELNPYLKAASVPVQFTERPVLCKTCRYYCTLLQRPGHNDSYASAYRRKLLHIYNVEVPLISENDIEDNQEDSKLKKKQRERPKYKQRKSTEPDKVDSESSERSERNSESTPEKEKKEDSDGKEHPLEEDIESLISSNKILVPNAKSADPNHQSDGSEPEMQDMEAPILPLDKQTELQYLLQKQNNPAQFLPKPNLTAKQRNILKVHNVSGIQKPATQHRIMEKNSKRIHKLGQILSHKEKPRSDNEEERVKEGIPILKNISLNEECTIESIPNKRPADINTLKNKWQMSESFTQVKKNLSELSKNKPEHHKKISEVKYSNPVKRLETNPSISVRELFPGEEEMNLQCNIEFNNVKGVTPEGWEKCNTMIQYDVETKKLWNELQRPYGNQSSFLRHLILLEKYFRSGDLVLSHNASPHAANYSDSVQSRLRAYDNVVNDTPRRSEPAISLIEFRKKPSLNGKSLLKTNLNEGDKETKKVMPPPPGVLPKPKSKSDKVKSKPLPPELIAINTPNAQGRKAIQNVLHNIQQLVKGVSASDPTEIAAAPLPIAPAAPIVTPPPSKPDPPVPVVPIAPAKEKKESSKKEDTPKKTKTTSKPWRPTLMPITQENVARIDREPKQIAVDGRTLPSLVQVMSSGKRYHITLQDYNKMCIMRREKLQQIQDGEKTKRASSEDSVVTEIQPSNAQCAMLGNGGSVVQNIAPDDKQDKKELPEMTQIGTNAATILKNVGLKNITIAPIPQKTATVTSQTVASPIVSSPSLLVTSTPMKLPTLGPSMSITSETPLVSHLALPRIPRSLTVIPQSALGGSGPGAPTGPGGPASVADGPRP
ncbi:hypothetical protein PYW07_012035 [Mythimna separata]|uniref:Uncharacterized protein n=1 Tax=Mythimna separata TaxID=271217 RepID=A0AAD7YKF6_MYTSE|nr:hypothetical protein PYW07_012035 [Mythimna separata]